MQAGQLDRKITIERRGSTQSDSGQPLDVWTAVASRIWAAMMPLLGDRRFTTPEFAASEQVEFRVRYSSAVADVSPLDRVLYPAPVGAAAPTARQVYEILAVHELGRREGLRLITRRRPDATA